MMQPSDNAVLVMNQAVRDLREMFTDEYEFYWCELDKAGQFEIVATAIRLYPPTMQRREEMSRVQFWRTRLDYGRVETMQADDVSGEVFQQLSEDKRLGFGQ
jgi:hypothetical protein